MTTLTLPPTEVVIIGAGFSGLTMACNLELQLQLRDYCIYDRNPEMGGVWYTNKYPGCSVDIPGFCYHLSFSTKPVFSRLYPPQEEIREYITSVAAQFSVHQHFTGSLDWTGCEWDDATREWTVGLRHAMSGISYRQKCRFLISCVGGLTNPREPRFAGMARFQGPIMHTAKWDPTVDFRDKRVAVIGNGASAAQLIPALAGTPSSIKQIVRTPEHLVPSRDYDLSRFAQLLLHWVPGLWLIIRTLIFIYMEITFFYFRLSGIGQIGRGLSEKQSIDHVHRSAPKKYWPFLIPKYRFGCRRRIFDKAYTAALRRPDVELIRGNVVEITESRITLDNGLQVEVDIIVLATGFNLSHYDTRVQGRHGKTRDDHWYEARHKSTFKSVAMHGFPNFFYILGPNSGRLHTSTLLSIEWHSNYVTRVIKPIIRCKSAMVEVKAVSEKQYQKRLRAALDKTVHDKTCGSTFIDWKTGSNWFVYPWSSFHMWLETKWDSLTDWQYDMLRQEQVR